jgi:3-dehydroquinate dehydratase-1
VLKQTDEIEMKTNTTRLGSLRVGDIPYVVGTISSLESLNTFAAAPVNVCDIVEVRADKIGAQAAWLEGCKEIEALGMPVIFTIRLHSEGGKWVKQDKLRMPLFEDALKHLSAVDVEMESKLMPAVCKLAKSLQKSTVISFHDFDKTPSLGKLKEIAEKSAEHGSIVKISTMAKTSRDILTLQKLLDCDFGVPLCVIGMGASATKTRIAFPSMGSCLTYGYLDTPSAPGQLSAKTLNEQLRSILPGYNQQFIIQKQILEYA